VDRRDAVWAFLGDGEMDEPESLGAHQPRRREGSTTSSSSSTATCSASTARCAATARSSRSSRASSAAPAGTSSRSSGARLGPAARADDDGVLRPAHGGSGRRRLPEVQVEGRRHTASTSSARYPERLQRLVENMSTRSSGAPRGGHDPEKVYAAYRRRHRAQGRADGDPRQDDQGLRHGRGRRGEEHHPLSRRRWARTSCAQFRDRFGIPISDDELGEAPFYRRPRQPRR
jgi:pyruvate dehydrogenase E1 component